MDFALTTWLSSRRGACGLPMDSFNRLRDSEAEPQERSLGKAPKTVQRSHTPEPQVRRPFLHATKEKHPAGAGSGMQFSSPPAKSFNRFGRMKTPTTSSEQRFPHLGCPPSRGGRQGSLSIRKSKTPCKPHPATALPHLVVAGTPPAGKRAPLRGAPVWSLPPTLCSPELVTGNCKSSSPNFVLWCPFPQPPLFCLPAGEGGDTTRPPAAM